MCLETSLMGDDSVVIRHSKTPETMLRFTQPEWAAFVDALKAGKFDFLTHGWVGFGPTPTDTFIKGMFGDRTPIRPIPMDEPEPESGRPKPRRGLYPVC